MTTGQCVLLHEPCFALFAGVAWLRFAFALGPLSPEALLYLGLLLGSAVVTVSGPVLSGEAGAKLRLAVYPAAITVSYLALGPALTRAGAPLWDADLLRLDRLLTGTTPAVVLQPLVRPLLSDLLSACYALFIPYFGISLVDYFLRELPLARRFFVGVLTLYSIGLLGYLLVPARGPYLAFPGLFTVPLAGGAITRANATFVAIGSNHVDVFPSLHCGASAFMLAFDRRHSPARFRLFALPVAGLWLSTLYLRFRQGGQALGHGGRLDRAPRQLERLAHGAGAQRERRALAQDARPHRRSRGGGQLAGFRQRRAGLVQPAETQQQAGESELRQRVALRLRRRLLQGGDGVVGLALGDLLLGLRHGRVELLVGPGGQDRAQHQQRSDRQAAHRENPHRHARYHTGRPCGRICGVLG